MTAICPSVAHSYESIQPLGATTVAIQNPGFETNLNGWLVTTGQRTVPTAGQEYHPVPQGISCVIPTPGACTGNDFSINLVQQVSPLQANSLYECTVDVFPLTGDDHRLQFRILDSSTTYESYDTALYRPPWNLDQKTLTLTPGQWNRVIIGFSSADLPAYTGLPYFIQVTACGMAVDNVRLLRLPLTISPGNVTYYVSNSEGSDINAGIFPNLPWKSFDRLRTRLFAPGDRILLKRGDTWGRPLILRGNGIAGNPVTLGAYGDGERPTIHLADLERGRSITLENPSYWRVQGVAAREAKLGIYLRYLLSYDNKDVVIEDCVFSDMDSWTVDLPATNYEVSFNTGIFIGGRVGLADQSRTVLDGLTIRNVLTDNCTAGFLAGWYYPELIYNRVTNLLIEDSVSTRVSAGGLSIHHIENAVIRRYRTIEPVGHGNDFVWGTTGGIVSSSRNILFEDCEFSETDRRWYDDQAGDGCGLDIDGRNINVTVRDTVFHNNDGPGLLFLSTFGIRNSNVLIEDCTFYNNGLDGAVSFGGNAFEIKIPVGTLFGTFRNLGLYRSAPSWGWMHNPQPAQVTLQSMRTNWYQADVASRPAPNFAFTAAGNFQGWGDFNDWGSPAVTNGALSGTATGIDPFVHSPSIWINTHRQRAMVVDMRIDTPSIAQIFFQRETHPTWTPERSIAFELIPDGQFHRYELDMRSVPTFMGVVTRWRLDPTLTPGAQFAVSEVTALDAMTRTRPMDPTSLAAQRVGNNAAQLTWNDIVSDEEHYVLERSIGAAPFAWIATLSPDATGYLDTQITTNPDIRWRVRAFNAAGFSTPGAEVLLPPSSGTESLSIY
jgi:hypothetical protein